LTIPAGPAAAVAGFDEDLSAPSDDRPFFFLMADLDTFLSGRGFRDDHITRPVQTLGALGFVVMLLALLCIVLPALATRRQARTRGMLPFYVYFAGIGLGFLLVEISQLQRLSVFLGHPTYALTVVLFSLLLSSGAGSMLAERFSTVSTRSRPLLPLFSLLGVLVVFSLVQPAVIAAFAGATTPVRIAAAVAMLTPLGFLMGMPFPIGMRTATITHADPPTAFFWGINGAASVCASVMGMVLSLFFGITFAFWVGVAAYLATTLALLVVMHRARTPSAA
jgi:hypothetical protein